MNKNQKQLVVVALLGVALVGVVFFQVFRKSPPPPADNDLATAGKASSSAPAGKTPTAKAAAVTAKTSKASAAKTASAAAAGGQAASGPTTPMKRVDINIEDLLAGIKEVSFDYDQEPGTRDPMAPLVGGVAIAIASKDKSSQPVVPATLGQVMNKTVTGILWDKRYPLAVVDNEVVSCGYKYPDGTVVESVAPGHVTFKVGDSSIQVKLKEP